MDDEQTPSGVVKVKRDGPRGWHWIAADKFDPEIHELADERDPLDHDGNGRKGGSRKEPLKVDVEVSVEPKVTVKPARNTKAASK